jgi:hypothetical protein
MFLKIEVHSVHFLKPSSLKTPCSETQVDPILALSGSWQIGKKDVQNRARKKLHSKISNNFYREIDSDTFAISVDPGMEKKIQIRDPG